MLTILSSKYFERILYANFIYLLIIINFKEIIQTEAYILSGDNNFSQNPGENGLESNPQANNGPTTTTIDEDQNKTLNNTQPYTNLSQTSFLLNQNGSYMQDFWKQLSSEPVEDPVKGAKILGVLLEKFSDIELGFKKSEELYNQLPYDVIRVKGSEGQVKELADKFSSQLKDYQESLERMSISLKSTQEETYNINISDCCDIKSESLMYDEYFNTYIVKRESCLTLPTKKKPNLFIPNFSFNQVLVENSEKIPHLKWQYFVSPEGVQVEYPANKHNCLYGTRPNLLSPKSPIDKKLWLVQQKPNEDSRNHRIVFYLQLGPKVTQDMIKSVKSVVGLLLQFLDEADKVGIINSDVDESNFLCDQLVSVTSWTRYQIINYLEQRYKSLNFQSSDNFQENENRNEINGIQKAINMACANFSSESPVFPPAAATIIHLTGVNTLGRGLGNLDVGCPVFIETFFLGSLNTSEEIRYKTTLEGLASKNIWRVQVFSADQAEPKSFASKVALKISSKKGWWSLSDILSQFFPKDNEENETNINKFSYPHWNPVSKEAVIIAKKYVFQAGRPLGIIAVEIPLTYFTQYISYYSNENTCNEKNYVFLIDHDGRVIYHPSLGRPSFSDQILTPIQIENIEVHHGFAILKKAFLTQESGCNSVYSRKEKTWVTYAWSSTKEFEYVIVMVFYGNSGGCANEKEGYILKKTPLNPNTDIQHNQLLRGSICNNRLSNFKKASLYLSPNAFSRPAEILEQQFAPSQYTNKINMAFMAYIGDNSGFLKQSLGLKPNIKDHIGALSKIISTWKIQYFHSKWSKYISLRFASGAGGTFLSTYPGVKISPGYMISSTSWYKGALSKDRKISFTRPIVDSSGVPIITLSRAIYANIKVPNNSRQIRENPVAVLGAQVSIGFFQKMIEDLIPQCKLGTLSNTMATKAFGNMSFTQGPVNVRCLILDDSGYIIYHPLLSKSLKTSSEVHLTQLEPLSFIDVLQHSPSEKPSEMPIKKQVCYKLSATSSTQGSLQRFYSILIGPNGIHKTKHGDHCSRYSIVPIPNTNLYFAIVYDGCTSATPFCPCSTIDRLCLNCLRMEPNDCECPCECPREPSFCVQNTFSDLPEEIEPCEIPTDEIPMILSEKVNCDQNKTDCLKNNCDMLRTSCNDITLSKDCIGTWDCNWCEEKNDGKCESYKECYGYSSMRHLLKSENLLEEYNGVSLGDNFGSEEDEDIEDDNSGTLIPVFGVLSVFSIFLGLVVYCYRQRGLNSSNSQPELHLLPLQESPLCSIAPQAGSSRSDDSDTEAEPNVQPPLRMILNGMHGRRRGLRFPPPPRSPMGSAVGTDSDHGYSTMTPHEDSECGAPLPLISLEPPPKIIQRPQSSSKRKQQNLELLELNPINIENVPSSSSTNITNIEKIVVPVTVHCDSVS